MAGSGPARHYLVATCELAEFRLAPQLWGAASYTVQRDPRLGAHTELSVAQYPQFVKMRQRTLVLFCGDVLRWRSTWDRVKYIALPAPDSVQPKVVVKTRTNPRA